MRDRERGDDKRELLESPQWQHEAEQKQQVVDAVEDVMKTQAHERQGRLMPARIEPHESRVADEFKSPLGRAWRLKPEHGDHAQPQPREQRIHGEVRAIR